MGDKKIYELTKIDSAPANGVLPIDVPGSEETNGITVDNLARTMPVATSERNGLLGSRQLIDIINSLKGAGVVEGGIVDGIRNTGIYSVTSVIPSSGNLWGILVVFNSGYYILQLIFGASGRGFRYAHGQNDEWSKWVTL